MTASEASTIAKRLVCPKCRNTVIVDSEFRDQFYCHMCGMLMK
jgi:cytochrome c-type biogenesis protein CcmH/NrfF